MINGIKIANQRTVDEKIRLYERNAKANTLDIIKHGGVRIIDLSGRNVMVIGSGESLDENIDFIKANRGAFFIVSCDMAFRPLMVRGIRPDMTFMIETSPAPFFDGLDTSGILLCAYSLASKSNVRKWRGSKWFFNVDTDQYRLNKIYKRAPYKSLSSIISGGNVFSVALCYVLACNPRNVVLVGNDLGFRKLYYARNTTREVQMMDATSRTQPVETMYRAFERRENTNAKMARRGDITYKTNENFLVSCFWLEDLLRTRNVKNVMCVSDMGINCTKIALKNA